MFVLKGWSDVSGMCLVCAACEPARYEAGRFMSMFAGPRDIYGRGISRCFTRAWASVCYDSERDRGLRLQLERHRDDPSAEA